MFDKTNFKMVTGIVTAALMTSQVGATEFGDSTRCDPIRGIIEVFVTPCDPDYLSPVGLCTAGKTRKAGRLNGTTRFRAFAIAPAAGLDNENLMLIQSFSGELTIHTRRGDIVVKDVGIIDNENQLFTEVDRIHRGTGKWKKASGAFFVSGSNILADDGITPGFRGRMRGEICR